MGRAGIRRIGSNLMKFVSIEDAQPSATPCYSRLRSDQNSDTALLSVYPAEETSGHCLKAGLK